MTRIFNTKITRDCAIVLNSSKLINKILLFDLFRFDNFRKLEKRVLHTLGTIKTKFRKIESLSEYLGHYAQ